MADRKKNAKELTCTRLLAINKKDELLPLQWWYDSRIELIYRHLWPLDIWAPHYHGLQANQGDPRLCFWKLIPRGKHQFLQVPQAANIEPLLVEEVGPRQCRSMQSHPSHLIQQYQVCPQNMDLTQISLMLKYMHAIWVWFYEPIVQNQLSIALIQIILDQNLTYNCLGQHSHMKKIWWKHGLSLCTKTPFLSSLGLVGGFLEAMKQPLQAHSILFKRGFILYVFPWEISRVHVRLVKII